jgi:hypothetical protein
MAGGALDVLVSAEDDEAYVAYHICTPIFIPRHALLTPTLPPQHPRPRAAHARRQAGRRARHRRHCPGPPHAPRARPHARRVGLPRRPPRTTARGRRL